MASGSLLLLLDDIAVIMDDVAVMTKVAAKQTAGVIGDDLALNAEQLTGVRAERELPVVWAVAKGSMLNKFILVPVALILSVVYPPLITFLLICGGLFLCYEGAEKVLHKFLHSEHDDQQAERKKANADETIDLVAFEKEKIKGAIRTDFILSAEIIVIALGSAGANADFTSKAIMLSVVAATITIGVYGLVAVIVKMDDVGLYLIQQQQKAKQFFGRFLLSFAPKLMKFLSIAGTIAMFLVGGGILYHNFPALHHVIADIAQVMGSFDWALEQLLIGIVGFVAGVLIIGFVNGVSKLKK